MRLYSLFFILMFLISQSLSAKKQITDLEQTIRTMMAKYEGIGISAVVVKKNKICYSQTFGYNPDYNNEGTRNPISENGIYVIASISKTFVSTAIMQLVERNKIQLDDDVNKYLHFSVKNPKFPEKPITIRQLLCHRSSLNDTHYGWTLDQIQPAKGLSFLECYNDYAPGDGYSYCNLGYSLLGAIIENVTGIRFYDYIEKNITGPMGLHANYNITRIDTSRLVRAYLYNKKDKAFRKDNSIYNYNFYLDKLKNYRMGETVAAFSPTGGMKISAQDLARYMMMHMNYGRYKWHRILKKKSELEMWQPQMGNPKYGLAFSHYSGRTKKGDKDLVGMVGCAHGVHSSMLFNPEEKYGFVIICNGCTSDASDGQNLNTEIIRALYSYFIEKKSFITNK